MDSVNLICLASTVVIAIVSSVLVTLSKAQAPSGRATKVEPFESDNAQWYFDASMDIYCRKTGKAPDSLTEDDAEIIYGWASTHMAMFLTWAIMRGEAGTVHVEDEPQALQKVRLREMTGTEFLSRYCDCRLWKEDFSQDILPFVQQYYMQYLVDYPKFARGTLGKEEFSFPFSWEDYDAVQKFLDGKYARWKKKSGKGAG